MKKNKLIVLMSVISALILSVSLFTVGTAAEGETPSFTTVEAAGKYMREELISREPSIVLTLTFPLDPAQESGPQVQAMAKSIYAAATAHDASAPSGGDYILHHGTKWTASMSYSTSESCTATFSYSITYYTTAAQESALSARIGEVIASLGISGKTDYEKFDAIYDWIVKHVVYDYTHLNDGSYDLKYTAYAAMINGTSVCQGYANLLYRMLLTAGVDCRIITGDAVKTENGVEKHEPHAWNIVKLGSLWYNVDATWDSSATKITVNGMSHGSEYAMKYRLREASGFTDHIRDDAFLTEDFNAAHPMSTSDYAVPFFSGHSISLDGKIGVNFMLNLDGMSASEKSASYVEFTVAGRKDEVLCNLDSMNYTETSYKFTCLIPSIEMADRITAVYHYGGGRTLSQTYSLTDYLDYIEAHSGDYDETILALVRSLRDLGYYTQTYLSDLRGWKLGTDHAAVASPAKTYTSADISAASSAAAGKAPSIGTSAPVEKVTYSLLTDSGTGLNIYVRLAAGTSGALTATVSGVSDASVEQLPDGRWLIGIKNIAAHELGTDYTVSLSVGGSSAGTVKISALGYVCTALGLEGKTDGFRNAVASVALYHAAARSYIDKFYNR